MHENFHKNVNENMYMRIFHEFYDICYSYTLLISYNIMVLTFNPF